MARFGEYMEQLCCFNASLFFMMKYPLKDSGKEMLNKTAQGRSFWVWYKNLMVAGKLGWGKLIHFFVSIQ